jgi:thymidylate synthase (FAD)
MTEHVFSQVLDHGYVRLVESWGSDERVIEAARMSTQGGFRGWPDDEKLLRYLYTNGHMTPFEMAGAIIEVQAPIFVFREWHRHRTQSYNEASARYAPLPAVDYLPKLERVMMNAGGTNKQAGTIVDAEPLDEDFAREWQEDLDGFYRMAEALYQRGLEHGIPK